MILASAAELIALAERAEAMSYRQLLCYIDFEFNQDVASAIGWVCVDEIECQWRSPDGLQRQPPLFTSSIDDVLEYLLPKDHDWYIGDVACYGGRTRFAHIGHDIDVSADTVVLSLTAACLRAHAVSS
jgi:hypothetical protein